LSETRSWSGRWKEEKESAVRVIEPQIFRQIARSLVYWQRYPYSRKKGSESVTSVGKG